MILFDGFVLALQGFVCILLLAKIGDFLLLLLLYDSRLLGLISQPDPLVHYASLDVGMAISLAKEGLGCGGPDGSLEVGAVSL